MKQIFIPLAVLLIIGTMGVVIAKENILGSIFGPSGFIGPGSPASQGSGLFSDLLADDKEVARKQEEWDRKFAELHIGTDYWVEEICQKKIERIPEGVLITESGDYFNVIAHVEGERVLVNSYNESTGDQTEYLYKFTLEVRNPSGPTDEVDMQDDDQPLSFTVELKGERQKNMYSHSIDVADGESFNRKGQNMEISYSSYKYTEVCIHFNRPIRYFSGKGYADTTELCNSISEGSTKPSMYLAPGEEERTKEISITGEPNQGPQNWQNQRIDEI